MATPSIRRRSSFGGLLHNVLEKSLRFEPEVEDAAVPDILASGADEEKERKQRRGLQKRQSFGAAAAAAAEASTSPAPGTPTAASITESVTASIAGYSTAQLAEHYANCMKLSAENKINIKNAFQLKLIDYMAEMLRKKQSDMDNFQAASCALDASTKIYAYRVDSVHSETLKLASGVGRTATGKKGEGDDEGPGAEGGERGEADDADVAGDEAIKKRIRKKKKSNTVEKNLANINLSKFELEFDVDPLFKKVSAQFDSGAGGGQFLSTLQMRNDGCELLLDSNALVSEIDAKTNDDATSITLDVKMPQITEDMLVCSAFSTFSFCNWSLEKEEELHRSMQEEASARDKELPVNSDHAFDADAAANANFDDMEAQDYADDFGGDDMDYAGNDDREDMHRNLEKPRRMFDINVLKNHLASVPTEYTYFDSGLLGAWAGPKHWKFRAGPSVHKTLFSEEDGSKRARRKKEKLLLDFEKLLNRSDVGLLEDVEKSMSIPTRPITLQGKTMQNWNDDGLILPEDLHYSGKDFIILDSLPKFHVVAMSNASDTQAIDDSVDDYNFDNPNDTLNYCPPADDGASEYPQATGEIETSCGNTFFTQANAAESTNIFEGGLVAAPNRVEKVQIGYAKFAKKIDMRKLKAVEWSLIQECPSFLLSSEDKENSSTNKTEDVTISTEVTKDLRFSNMYEALRKNDRLPSKMVESLSVPLAFVALLHLCNEQTLEVTNCHDLSDLTIRKA
jgi:condensin complex subunit 2